MHKSLVHTVPVVDHSGRVVQVPHFLSNSLPPSASKITKKQVSPKHNSTKPTKTKQVSGKYLGLSRKGSLFLSENAEYVGCKTTVIKEYSNGRKTVESSDNQEPLVISSKVVNGVTLNTYQLKDGKLVEEYIQSDSDNILIALRFVDTKTAVLKTLWQTQTKHGFNKSMNK